MAMLSANSIDILFRLLIGRFPHAYAAGLLSYQELNIRYGD